MKKISLALALGLTVMACSNNREKVVQSQVGDVKINEGSIPVQANDVPGPETDADYMIDRQSMAGTPGITNDTTGSTTSGALNDPTGTVPNKSSEDRENKPEPKP